MFDCFLSFLSTTYLWFTFWVSHIIVLLLQLIYCLLFGWSFLCFPNSFRKGLGRLHHLSTIIVFYLNPFWSVKVIKQDGKSPVVPRGTILSRFLGLIFKMPVLGQVMYLSGHVPVFFYKDKEGKWKVKGKDKLKKRSETILKTGRRLIVFPEGKLSTDGNLLEFKMGYFNTSKETGAKIVPLAMWGNHKLFPPGDQFAAAHPGTVEVTFGNMVDPADFETAEELRDHVKGVIRDLRNSLPSYKRQFPETAASPQPQEETEMTV